MHFCRHMQSFKKTSLKLYEKLQSQSTHCLYIWGQKMTKFKKYKKVTKIWQGLYEKHMHIFRLRRKHVQSSKKISIKLYEELCSQSTHCLLWRKCAKFQKDWYKIVWGAALKRYPLSIYWGRKWLSYNVEKSKNKLEMCLQYMDATALTPSPAQGHDPGATVPYIKRSWCR